MNNFLVKTSGLALAEDNSVKTLMLLHGWGMNSQVWEPIREALESRYQLLWVDLPGHGFNRHTEAQNLEQIVDLITEVTTANTHLIGWSLGGLVAQALAHNLSQRMPQLIKSMTLITSTPRFSQDLEGDWQHAMSDAVLSRFADNLKQDTEKTLKGFIALQFIGEKNAKQAQNELINHILNTNTHTNNKDSAKGRGGVIFNDSKPITGSNTSQSNIPNQQALDVGLGILKNADLRHIKATCPEHWVFAEYDRLIPKEVINDLISLRPDAEITLLKKSGHAPFITHPDIFIKRVTDFIEALD